MIETFEMIKPGDRVLVCLSGGKDSLTLLHTMKQYQYYTKMAFDLGAMTIDPQSSEIRRNRSYQDSVPQRHS